VPDILGKNQKESRDSFSKDYNLSVKSSVQGLPDHLVMSSPVYSDIDIDFYRKNPN